VKTPVIAFFLRDTEKFELQLYIYIGKLLKLAMLEITGTTEYFDKIQNNRYSENWKHFEKFISTFRLNYSHHQEMNDDDITYYMYKYI
jgi:hypothetical protein